MRLRVRASLRSRVGVRGRARVRASPLLPRVGWGGGGERRGGAARTLLRGAAR